MMVVVVAGAPQLWEGSSGGRRERKTPVVVLRCVAASGAPMGVRIDPAALGGGQ